ncbi:aminoglycoside phosphotransferase (APT) family kinase protein [Actinomycetospora succinea]|uniref:Aminoglycoside phosphotransferase (APT) family kinase protein n=1 Tax=Actinomycetospora succinea TaxID=663603 RepID=A0A4R6UY33_9PSEU|nr:phosphotransferase family protein [Actinomycetospora succinea]TDQ50959.1 aminoglycoside phosphotransferase (APT) family kinase protein [Actinomycetospora succinea]
MTVPRTPDELVPALAEVLGGTVTDLRRLSAGASRETWTFEADGRRLVLRRDPPGAPRPAEMAREAECLRAAARAGLPVPPLLRAGDGTDAIGTPYLVMEHVAGESLPGRLLRDERWAAAREGMARELGRVLARIHAIDPREVPSLPTVTDPLADLRATYDGFGETRPGLEVAFRWLAAHRPPAVPPTVVHGDFRNGNLLVAPDGLAAVLDWELAHLGDPREDLGWVCTRAWRFGAQAEVGGFGSREELLAGYAEVAGAAPDTDAVRWWEVYGCVHWAVICRIQAERHLGGTERSMELAVLGRRAVEAEYDALLALGLVSGVPAVPTVARPTAERPPAECPTVDELLEAVRGFLADELVVGDDRSRYLARVARNALGIVARELASDPSEHRAALAAAGCADDAELGGGLRSGALDPADGPVAAAVRSAVLTRLAVANPRYA